MRWPLVMAIGLALTTGVARAEIYEWTDAVGARHFTNVKEALPPDQRSTARVLISEPEMPVAPSAPAAAAAPAAAPSEAEVVYDRAGWRQAYASGIRDGLALAQGSTGLAGGSVNISGPLAVANARSETLRPSDYYYPYYYYPYYPFVTTSFDRGRSRHLTLRMLLQDQFQLDRDGPFLYERVPPVGLGPNLQAFLPRGLPKYFPAHGTRVLFR
jgi:hypothetical protein